MGAVRALAVAARADPSLRPAEFVRVCVVVLNTVLARTAQLDGNQVSVVVFGERGGERILVHDADCELLLDLPLEDQ